MYKRKHPLLIALLVLFLTAIPPCALKASPNQPSTPTVTQNENYTMRRDGQRLTWSREMYIDIVGLLAIATIFFGIYQWRKSTSHKKADYVQKLVERMFHDPDIIAAFRIIDYEDEEHKEWYPEKIRNDKVFENRMDQFFYFFSYICYLHDAKVIDRKQLKFFEYELVRIFQSHDAKNYLFNIHHFAKECKEGCECTFYYLIKYGLDHNLLDPDFTDKNSPNYLHYLIDNPQS